MVRWSGSSVLLFVALVLLAPGAARAQLPECTGHDVDGASAEFEAGNALLAQSIEQLSHRRVDRAHELATQALAHFDRQCELGDTSAYAERGAALLLLGEPLRSAESYDAYLRAHPLDSLDARTRRRLEPNLQPGTLDLEVENPRGHLFVDELDFGALPRTTGVRVPYGEHVVEVRGDDGSSLASTQVSLSAESSHAAVHLFVEPLVAAVEPEVVTVPVVAPPPPPPPEPASARTDFFPFYLASGITAGVGLAIGVGLVIAADERARTYNATCYPTIVAGCTSVLSERDTDLVVSVIGFVVAGLGVVGLVTTWILDASQPRERVRLSIGPTGISGAF